MNRCVRESTQTKGMNPLGTKGRETWNMRSRLSGTQIRRGLLETARVWDEALSLLYPNECQLCRQEPAHAHTGFVGIECERLVRPIRPPYCQQCGLPYSGAITQTFVCANCRDLSFEFDQARAAVEAHGPVLDAIHQYKYQRALWLEPFFLQCLLPVALPDLNSQHWDGIVPVPLHPTRLREREFNQAERLASALARSLHVPLRTDLVRRHRWTATQTRLHRGERLTNMRHAFSPNPKVANSTDFTGTRWIVIDDVFTTGATTNAVAHVLKRLGASEVVVWTVARGT